MLITLTGTFFYVSEETATFYRGHLLSTMDYGLLRTTWTVMEWEILVNAV